LIRALSKGTGRVEDTINLLGHAARKIDHDLGRAWAALAAVVALIGALLAPIGTTPARADSDRARAAAAAGRALASSASRRSRCAAAVVQVPPVGHVEAGWAESVPGLLGDDLAPGEIQDRCACTRASTGRPPAGQAERLEGSEHGVVSSEAGHTFAAQSVGGAAVHVDLELDHALAGVVRVVPTR
jgi:hypothetical protein